MKSYCKSGAGLIAAAGAGIAAALILVPADLAVARDSLVRVEPPSPGWDSDQITKYYEFLFKNMRNGRPADFNTKLDQYYIWGRLYTRTDRFIYRAGVNYYSLGIYEAGKRLSEEHPEIVPIVSTPNYPGIQHIIHLGTGLVPNPVGPPSPSSYQAGMDAIMRGIIAEKNGYPLPARFSAYSPGLYRRYAPTFGSGPATSINSNAPAGHGIDWSHAPDWVRSSISGGSYSLVSPGDLKAAVPAAPSADGVRIDGTSVDPKDVAGGLPGAGDMPGQPEPTHSVNQSDQGAQFNPNDNPNVGNNGPIGDSAASLAYPSEAQPAATPDQTATAPGKQAALTPPIEPDQSQPTNQSTSRQDRARSLPPVQGYLHDHYDSGGQFYPLPQYSDLGNGDNGSLPFVQGYLHDYYGSGGRFFPLSQYAGLGFHPLGSTAPGAVSTGASGPPPSNISSTITAPPTHRSVYDQLPPDYQQLLGPRATTNSAKLTHVASTHTASTITGLSGGTSSFASGAPSQSSPGSGKISTFSAPVNSASTITDRSTQGSNSTSVSNNAAGTVVKHNTISRTLSSSTVSNGTTVRPTIRNSGTVTRTPTIRTPTVRTPTIRTPTVRVATPTVRVPTVRVPTISDIRLKRDIAEVERLPNGIHLYRYRYVWSDAIYVGVMAQEVAAIVPDAVILGDDGYLRVDYGRLGLEFLTWNEWIARAGVLQVAPN